MIGVQRFQFKLGSTLTSTVVYSGISLTRHWYIFSQPEIWTGPALMILIYPGNLSLSPSWIGPTVFRNLVCKGGAPVTKMEEISFLKEREIGRDRERNRERP